MYNVHGTIYPFISKAAMEISSHFPLPYKLQSSNVKGKNPWLLFSENESQESLKMKQNTIPISIPDPLPKVV